jgi:chemotaxis protein CheX
MTNVKFLNPFVNAAAEVLEIECGMSSHRGNITLQKTALTADEITVMISLIGHVQGVVLYGLSVATGLALVSRVMSQEFLELDNLAQSGIAELGNVITGRATVNMSQAGYEANISPPTLIIGQGTQISTLDFARIVVPIMTELGTVTAHLALRESLTGTKEANIVPVRVPTQAGQS